MAASRRSADRALLRDRPALPLLGKKRQEARPALAKDSDIQVMCNWNKLDIEDPPAVCGVYAVTSARKGRWYYIGKSQNISTRIVVKNHPIQVTQGIKLGLCYWYIRVDHRHLNWAERYLIKEYDPEWNGHTAFSSVTFTPWVCCDLPPCVSDEQLLAAIGGAQLLDAVGN
jgi:hypothetical protein